MKKTTRTITFILAVILMMTMAACTSNNETATAETAATQITQATEEATQAPTAEPTPAEPIVITMLIASDNPVSSDNPILNEVKERTGYIIEADMVGSADYQTKLSAMIASESLPDIIGFGLSDGEEFAENGMIIELTDLIKEYGPVILEDKGEGLNEGLNSKDETWGVPYGAIYPSNLSIRTDWLDNLGMDMPTDIDSLYDVLYAFTFDDPDGDGEQNTTGLGATMAWTKNFESIFGAFGIPYARSIQLSDGTVTTYMKHENYLDAINYFRKLYDDGLMEKEFATIPVLPCAENLWNGVYGAFDFQAAGTTNNWLGRYTEDPIPTFDFTVISGPGGSGGVVEPRRSSYWGITSTCESPADAMKLANYLTTAEGDELLYLGIEGTHYNWIDEDEGTYELISPYDDSATHRGEGAFIYWRYFVPNNNNAEYRTMNPQTRKGMDIGFANLLDDAYIYSPLDTEKEYGATLFEITKEAFATLIVTDGDVEAEYQAFVERWMDEGGAAWEEEATRVYAEENP